MQLFFFDNDRDSNAIFQSYLNILPTLLYSSLTDWNPTPLYFQCPYRQAYWGLVPIHYMEKFIIKKVKIITTMKIDNVISILWKKWLDNVVPYRNVLSIFWNRHWNTNPQASEYFSVYYVSSVPDNIMIMSPDRLTTPGLLVVIEHPIIGCWSHMSLTRVLQMIIYHWEARKIHICM